MKTGNRSFLKRRNWELVLLFKISERETPLALAPTLTLGRPSTVIRALGARYVCYPPNAHLPAFQPARYLDSPLSLRRRS